MATTKKQELAVIDFTQFSVAQLPELKGKKEEIKSVIEANPIVEIVDNASYESAKKSRTAVRTLRTSLEKEQKDVEKKIKDHVLGVIKQEYDTLVLGVKSAEQSRQELIDVWEEKKEQERKEKAIAEQQRIDGIKTKISDYVASWKEAFGFMVFGSIKEVSENFAESNANFDKTALQEFDVLFDREVSTLTELLDSKIFTLEEQEKIRVDNLLIQEKNAEQSLIQEWQRTWNANIDTLSVSDIVDVKSVLAKSKLANLKHYVSAYEEIYLSTEKRLNSQIEFVSKAEEQRIAQEKLNQEKEEFEKKQAEAKFKERKNILFDEGYWEIFFKAEANENDEIAKSKLVAYSEDEFDKFVDAVKKARTPVEAIEVVGEEEVVELPALEVATEKIDQIAQETEETYKALQGSPTPTELQGVFTNANNVQEVEFEEVESSDVAWSKIYDEWNLASDKFPDAFEWLEKNYNVPTKKQ
jgi:hypothetical protein